MYSASLFIFYLNKIKYRSREKVMASDWNSNKILKNSQDLSFIEYGLVLHLTHNSPVAFGLCVMVGGFTCAKHFTAYSSMEKKWMFLYVVEM